MRVSGIADMKVARPLTRQYRDTKMVETSVGDGLLRVLDKNGACNSDSRSHDRRKAENPLPNEQSTDDYSQNC